MESTATEISCLIVFNIGLLGFDSKMTSSKFFQGSKSSKPESVWCVACISVVHDTQQLFHGFHAFVWSKVMFLSYYVCWNLCFFFKKAFFEMWQVCIIMWYNSSTRTSTAWYEGSGPRTWSRYEWITSFLMKRMEVCTWIYTIYVNIFRSFKTVESCLDVVDGFKIDRSTIHQASGKGHKLHVDMEKIAI